MENQIKLTTEQLSHAINQQVIDGGLNELFSMTVNALMLGERSNFLQSADQSGNKGNGFRQLLKSGIGSGMELRVPRDRLGVFRPILLGVLEQQDQRIKELSFALYGEGLTTRQISTILEQIYGTTYSKSSVSRISKEFDEVVQVWLNRPLEAYYPIVFIDAIHVKIRRDTVATEAFYVVLGVKPNHTREVLAIVNLPTESATGWASVLNALKDRGLEKINLLVSDDLKGLDVSIGKCFKTTQHQKCILHFQRNLNKSIRLKDRAEFADNLKTVFNPDDKKYTVNEAVNCLKETLCKWQDRYKYLRHTIDRNDLEAYFTYLNYNVKVRRMIYTTNWIERLNKSFRRTLKVRNALPTPEAAELLIGYVSMQVTERTYQYPVTSLKFEPKFSN